MYRIVAGICFSAQAKKGNFKMDGMEFFNIEMDQDLAATAVPAVRTGNLANPTQAGIGDGALCKFDKKGDCSFERGWGFIVVCKGNPCRG